MKLRAEYLFKLCLYVSVVKLKIMGLYLFKILSKTVQTCTNRTSVTDLFLAHLGVQGDLVVSELLVNFLMNG